MLQFSLLILKKHILARNRVILRILCENRFGDLGCGALEKLGKKKPSKHFRCTISRIWGKETPPGTVTKFCMLADIQDLITYTTFGDDQLKVWS